MSIHVENKTLRSLSATICAAFRASTNRFLVLSLLAAVTFCARSTQAANGTWLNTGTTSPNWNTANNWVGGTIPGIAGITGGLANNRDTATFNTAVGTYGTSGNPIVIDNSNGWNLWSISFDTSAGSYTIGTTSGNVIQISNGGAIQILSTLTTGNITETINAPLVIQGNGTTQYFRNNGTQSTTTLQINGQVSGGFNGTQTLNLEGSNTGTNRVTGNIIKGTAPTFNLTKIGVGTWTLSGANTYNGATTVSAGILKVDAGAGGSLLTTGAYSALAMGGGTFNYDNTTASGAKAQNMGALTFTAGDSTVIATRTAAQSVALTFSSLGTRTAGAIANFVYGGTPGTIGTDTAINLTGKATGFIDQGTFYNGGTSTADFAWMNGAGTYNRGINYGTDANSESITASTAAFTGGKLYAWINGSGAITGQTTASITSMNIANANNVTLAGGATLTVNGILKSGNTAGGSITGGTGIQAGSGAELVVRADQSSDTLTIATPILANGTNALTKSGAGTLTLTSTNIYSGATYLNAGTLKLANQNAATNSTVTMVGGTLVFDSVAGTDFTFGGLAAASAGTGFNIGLTNSAGNAIALTIGGNNAATTYAGVLSGAGSLTKIGTNTLTLTGASTFTGNVNVNGGTLAGPTANNAFLGSGTAARNITVNNGGVLNFNTSSDALGGVGSTPTATLVVNSGGTVTNSGVSVITLGPVNLNGGTMFAGTGNAVGESYLFKGAVTVGGSAPSYLLGVGGATSGYKFGANVTFNVADVTASSSEDLIVSGQINGTNGTQPSVYGFIKTGNGTMLLTTNNTYTGTTTVSNGTLQVNGTVAMSSATVMTNAVLCGTGTLGSNVTINAGGILAAGTTNTVGGAAIAGTLTLQDNSRLLVDVQSLSQNDLITVAKNVTMTSTVKVEVSSGVTRSGTWTIMQSTGGTISGTLPTTVIGAPKGATLTLSTDSKQLLLTFLPQGTMIRFL
jgi:autotransporter-associated beta strand protein